MNLVGMILWDTLVLGFLVETSYIKERDRISLIFLLENMASSGSLGHPRKNHFFLYIQCSSSPSESEAIHEFYGHSTLSELDPTSFFGLFFFNNSGGNE
jgi:hypothetical protein